MLSFSLAVISFSLGVIIELTKALILDTLRKSLDVTIPTKFSSSTTGIPEIFNSFVS